MTTTVTTTPRDEVRAMQNALDGLNEQSGTLSADRLKQKAGDLHAKAFALSDLLMAKQDKGDEDFDTIDMAQNVAIAAGVLARNASTPGQARPAGNPNAMFPGTLPGDNTGAAQWVNAKTGEPVMVLDKGQRLTDHLPGRKGSLGKALRGMMTGDWGGAEFEQALSTNVNSAGGFLVPDALTANVIDLARNKSVLMSMGAQVFPMEAQSVTIARVTDDPTFEVKGENNAFSGSSVAFDAIGLSAATLGTVITMSNELIQDSINGTAAIENALADALAVEIDRQLLVGSGSGEIHGVANQNGIQTTGSIGSIHWDDLLDAMEDLMDVNAEATGYATTPLLATALAKLKTGDGSTAAANYLAAPPSVAELRRMTSNQIPTGHVYVADWTKILVGVRLNATVEFSRDAGEAFDRYQTKVRMVWRGDSNIERANNFVKLTDATA